MGNDKVFSKEELYDLVNAQDSAQKLKNSTGINSAWYDFVLEKEYLEKMKELSCGQEVFENELSRVASMLEDEFDDLVELNVDDYEVVDEYLEDHAAIQRDLERRICILLKDFCI